MLAGHSVGAKQAGKQAGRQAGRQVSKQAGKQASKQAGKQVSKQASASMAFSRSHALEGLVFLNAPLIGQFFLKDDETMDEDQVELIGLAV